MLPVILETLGDKLEASTTALLAVGALVVWYVVSSAVTWHHLRMFPGPRTAAFSYWWGIRTMWSGEIQDRMALVQRKYGPVVRIGPKHLMIADPDTLYRLSSARSAYTRSTGWHGSMRLDMRAHHLITEPDMANHDKRKAKLASGYAGKGEMNLEKNIDIQLANLIQYLNHKLDSGTDVLDLSKVFKYFQIDLITQAGMGEAWGYLTDDKDRYGYIESIEAIVRPLNTAAMAPIVRSFLSSNIFLRLAAPKPTDKDGLGRILGIWEERIDQRFSQDPEKRQTGDMLDEWMKHGLSALECKMDMSLQVPAGTDTSVTTMRGILLYLASSPAVYRKLKNEISQAIDEDRISSPVTHEEAKKLPFLAAVILEGMRLTPAVTMGFPKVVPPEGDIILGQRVPGGTEIFANFIMTGQDESIFGPDVNVFRPERFLEEDADAEVRQRRVRAVELNFGTGRWMCLGKSLAQMELRKVFVELLRNFDFQIVHPETPWKRRTFLASIIHDFMVKVTRA